MKFDHYQRKFLEKRIDFRMKNLNLNYYQDYLDYIRENPVEIDLFLDKFTINYTYFFRNYNIYKNFEKYIKFYINYKYKPLRIWSAPCATGDEPYSIAIILDQLKNNSKNFPDFKIVASDIDPAALRVAKNGIYGEYSVHETPEVYLKTYFSRKDTEIGPKYILTDQIRERVEFIKEDIIKGHSKNIKYDVIFCRNFFIYINQFARENLLQILESRLFDGGLLILGGSETLPTKNTNFKSIHMRDRFYIKNLLTQEINFKNRIYSLFKSQTISKLKGYSLSRKQIKQQDNKEIIKIKTPFEVVPKTVPRVKISEKEINKKNSKPDKETQVLNEAERMETEVRITGIEVNNSFNGYNYHNNLLTDTIENSDEESIKSTYKKWEQAIKQRELLAEQREKFIEERISYLEDKYYKIKQKRKEVNNLLKDVKNQEAEVKNRIEILERLTKRVENREKLLEQKEKQIKCRLRQVGDYTRQIIQQEVQSSEISRDLPENNEIHSICEQKRIDQIEKANKKKELKIPMGYYGLINSFDKSETATKFIIEGLGSGIALILKDPVNNIFGMSHISLPSSSSSKQGYHLLFPHTFVDTSVKDLYNNLLYNGANKTNITALIIGGAKLFLDYDMTYQENIDAVKVQLEVNQIKIETEDIGGLSERAVIYDTINDTLYVKKTWEFEYRKII